jgi:peroxiredoxin Q/BCP
MLQVLGTWGDKKLYGKVSMAAVGSTFVFDAAGKLDLVYPKVKAQGHAAKVLEDTRKQGSV